MELFTDLPQTTQIGIGLAVLLLLTVLIAAAMRQRHAVAVKPADEANRSERRRRSMRRAEKGVDKTPRRKRRKLAQEAAHAMGGAQAPSGAASEVPATTAAPVAHTDPLVATAEAPSAAEVAAAVVDVKDEDPYVTVESAPAVPVAAGAVAQPGWPSPGELASGFDPDAFDPLPPEEEHFIHDPAAVAEAAVEPVASDDTQVIAIADGGDDWDSDDEFDPATGWIDEDVSVSTSAAIWGDSPADVEADAGGPADVRAYDADHTVLAGDAEWDDDSDEDARQLDAAFAIDGIPTDAVAAPDPVQDEAVAWLDDDDACEADAQAAAPEPIAPEPIAAGEDDWTEGDDAVAWSGDDWSDVAAPDEPALAIEPDDAPEAEFPADEESGAAFDAEADLAVPFPLPGTLPAHEATAVDMLTPEPMPALSGRIDAGPRAPVVIDLASLVAHGDRVQVVIEHDEHGNGVRLRFETAPATQAAATADASATPDAEPPHNDATAAVGDGEPTAEVREPTVAEIVDTFPTADPAPSVAHEPLNVPFLMGEAPEAAERKGPWEPVDQEDTAVEDGALDVLDHDGEISVEVAPDARMDDPTRILADIRARLAALDARRFGD